MPVFKSRCEKRSGLAVHAALVLLVGGSAVSANVAGFASGYETSSFKVGFAAPRVPALVVRMQTGSVSVVTRPLDLSAYRLTDFGDADSAL